MNESSLDKRIELKFLFDYNQKNKVLNAIKSSNYLFKTQYPERTVSSIYFDSVNLNEFFNSVEGNFIKKKFRYRFYGDQTKSSIVNGQWEVKKKEGITTKKITFYEDMYIKTLQQSNTINYRSKHIKVNGLLKNYPIRTNSISYNRQYYISGLFGSNLRLTTDFEIEPLIKINKNKKREILKKFCVLEIKVAESLYNTVKLDNFVNLTRVGFSKYVSV